MRLEVVEAECVDIYCYYGTKKMMFEMMVQGFEKDIKKIEGKTSKVVFMLTNLKLKDYSQVSESLKNTYGEMFLAY